MELFALLSAARAAIPTPDDPEALGASLADCALGEQLEARRALLDALIAGYPAALARGDEASAARIAAELPARIEREAALLAWRALIDETPSRSASRWRSGAKLAAHADLITLIAGRRSEARIEELAIAVCRWRPRIEALEITRRIERDPREIEAALRSLPPGTPLVGYDLPHLLGHLPADLVDRFEQTPVADLAESASWLAEQGALAVSSVGLADLARSAEAPLRGESAAERLEAAEAVWFRLLRPRLLEVGAPAS